MLRRNINVDHGLVNGAMGVIRKIDWPALRREQLEPGELPQAIFVEFDDATITGNKPGIGVRIEPSTSEFDALRGKGKIERRMLPLILSWAVTVHKLHGTTLDRAVVDLSSHLFTKGQAYVALSRVRSLAGLAISALDPKIGTH
uniref:SFRICE_031991 n=1 Tax=Spodoptera frugiperda TaxID=7108 RepID=A0A2H1V3D6_SPOFR